MDREKDAYFAGLFDGEGCIHGQLTTLHVSLAIEMTCKEAIEAFIAHFELTSPMSERQRPEGRRAIYGARAYGDDVVRVLDRMLPYLIVKKVQAELAIEIRRGYNDGRRFSRTGGIPVEEKYRRAKLITAIHEANHGK